MSSETSIVAVFDTHHQASDAIRELQVAGFDMKQLSIVGKGFHSEEQPVGFYSTGDRVKSWGGIGAFWGGLWGLLVSAAFFWLPGIGPVAAAGPIVHALVGAMEGAAVVGGVGALGAALASMGVPKDSIIKYEKEMKADKYLLIARGDEQALAKAREILERVQRTKAEAVSA
jgi:uncharacterized membrane protein